ncbi:MAG: gamma-glutamyltransferase, partial [Pseudomonadota bacterium]
LAPAIRLARDGFPVDGVFIRLAKSRLEAIRTYAATANVFLVNNEVPAAGSVLKQPDLANTLAAIALKGRDGFYKGFIGAQMVDEVRRAGGLWATDDLFNYAVKVREPLTAMYRGYRIVSAPPPSSGGVALIEILNILATYELPRLDEATRTHVIVEAMRRAYRDRAEFLGDPDFTQVPLERLMHPWYAAGLRATLRLDRATSSSELPGVESPPQGPHTTHYSILDKEGNRVAATVTLNFPFGSGFLVPGTGVVLNNEMDDFSVKPGVPNGFGLIGGDANAIAAGKRPLSSMAPSFIEAPDGNVAILGTPGGSRIISMVLLAALDFMDGHTPDSWVTKGRFHHQYLPDIVQYEENGLPGLVIAGLRQRGHRLEQTTFRYGNMQAILWDRKHNRVLAAADPRGIGSAQVILHAAKNTPSKANPKPTAQQRKQ